MRFHSSRLFQLASGDQLQHLLRKTHKNKTPFTAHGRCGDEPGVSYPPRRHWRSSVHPDSSPAPAGRSVWWPPAQSAPAALSPGGRSAGSGFAASGTGSCPQTRCTSASWRKEKRRDVEIQSPWHPWFDKKDTVDTWCVCVCIAPKQSAATVPGIQDCAREVSEIFEDGCRVLQL